MKISDDDIVSAVLSTSSKKAAAKKLGVTERTLFNRLTPDVRAQIDEARTEALSDAVGVLKQSTTAAASCMIQLMLDKETSPQTRLNAATEIIRSGIKLTEVVAFEKRIAMLEAACKGDSR